jgi:hypothetical protein
MHILQAIRTRYHGPTNYRSARIIATSSDGRRYTATGQEIDFENDGDAHRNAARLLIKKNGWEHLAEGFISGRFGDACYHVFGGGGNGR